MAHFIVSFQKRGKSQYQYPRRATSAQYVSRTTSGPDKGQARVFNTSASAKNSMRQAGIDGEVIEVELNLLP